MQNMQAICRFWWHCSILHAICKICKIICTICKICKCHFQYAEYALPTLLMWEPDLQALRLIWILARYYIVRLRTMSYVHPTTSYVIRTMSGSTSHVRYRTYDITYDIARTTSYVCQHRRCDIRHRTSDVRYRRFRKIYVVYDVVCQPKPTMSYVWKCISYTMS